MKPLLAHLRTATSAARMPDIRWRREDFLFPDDTVPVAIVRLPDESKETRAKVEAFALSLDARMSHVSASKNHEQH